MNKIIKSLYEFMLACLVLPMKVPPGMPPVVIPPGVIESVDVVEEEVVEGETTMKPAEGEGLCACYQGT